MLWDIYLEVREIGIVELFEGKPEFTLITLTNLAVISVHLDRFFLLILIRVSFPLLLLLFFRHLLVHLTS